MQLRATLPTKSHPPTEGVFYFVSAAHCGLPKWASGLRRSTKIVEYKFNDEIAMATPVYDHGGDLKKPLQKTQAVTSDLQTASDHALVIGTVLAQELPPHVQVGEVAQAIEQTEELKEKLAESAETLTEVSAELEQEIAKRQEVAKQLQASRAKVEALKAEVSDSQKN